MADDIDWPGSCWADNRDTILPRILLHWARKLMSQLPPQELLDATHRFPGKFLFKVIGRSDDDFAARAVATVREALSHDFDPPYELRHTTGGRHVSVSIEPWVESSEQALVVFARIRTLSGLVMLM